MAEGLLLVDKKSGITSHDAVEKFRRRSKIKKVGHFLRRNVPLQTFGHERLAAGAQLVNLASRNHGVLSPLLPQRDRSREA